jgi:hypothetical protein
MKHYTKRYLKYQNRKTQKKYIGGSNDLPETIAIKNALLKCDSSDVDEEDDKYKSLFASLKGQKMRQALWDELTTKGFLSVEPIKPTQTSGLNKEGIIKLLYCLKYNTTIETIPVETDDKVESVPMQEPDSMNELEQENEPIVDETNDAEIVSDEEDIIEEDISDSEKSIDEVDDLILNVNITNEEKDIPLDEMKRITDQYKFLYPSLDDSEFNKKIAIKKEFSATQYNGKQERSVKDVSNDMCEQEFELMPHQNFVKNFLSYQTPYNALLLYHGLGTGKTCSAIGIAEEMREYMRQIGMSSKIFIVASPNVHDNFRLQLFDERKLVQTGDIWSLNNCVGNKLIKEVNPYATKGVTKDILKTKIRNIIRENYRFIGYTQLANHIIRRVGSLASDEEPSRKEIQLIKKYFNNKLFIVDEFHNISVSDANKEKKRIGSLLMKIAKYSDNMRLLLLSATPMYNSPREVVWFTNLLNSIDKRKPIKEKYVFDKDDNFLTEKHKDTNMTGEEYLKSKLTGYVSYVRGENPYTFPFRIYPKEYPGVLSEPENNIQPDNYPSKQLNGRDIEEGIQDFPTYITKMDENSYQEKGYKLILDALQLRSANYDKYGKEREMPDFSNMEAFGYTYLQRPLEALTMVYPNVDIENNDFDKLDDDKKQDIVKYLVGKNGLANNIQYETNKEYNYRFNFKYKDETKKKFGRFFNQDNIGNYSSKLKNITQHIINSNGIVMIYSNFIDGGVIPTALALEEMGFQRFSSMPSHNRNLFDGRASSIEPIDYRMKKKSELDENTKYKPAKYVMITGDKMFSPNNVEDLKYVTNENNKNGEQVKVVIISKAAAEGLDFKNIRQIHLLEPWYNTNRSEQIIGRAVRNSSHCVLDFDKRNVEIYLHSTSPIDNKEAADMYVYRYAEKKAKKIGKVTRLLKEISVDCLLNEKQKDFSINNMDETVNLSLSSNNKKIDYTVGDRPNTNVCDYMDSCEYTCNAGSLTEEKGNDASSYNIFHARINHSVIVKRLRSAFRERLYYHKDTLMSILKGNNKYTDEEAYLVLSRFLDNDNEYLVDEKDRKGTLINKQDYYIFQPTDFNDETASLYERSLPTEYKPNHISIEYEDSVVVDKTPEVDYQIILDKMKEHLDEAIRVKDARTEVKRKDYKDKFDMYWYANAGSAFHKIKSDPRKIVEEMTDDDFTKYIIYHNIDTMNIDEKLMLLSHIYDKKYDMKNEVKQYTKQYFEKKIVDVPEKNQKLIVLAYVINNETTTYSSYVAKQDKLEKWSIVSPEREKDYITYYSFMKVPYNKFNNVIGFISFQHQSNTMMFKFMDINPNKNNPGVFCEFSQGKTLIPEKLNKMSSVSNYYTYDYLVRENDELNLPRLYKAGLCALTELLLRHYDEYDNIDEPSGKRWFISLEEYLHNKLFETK